MKASLLAGTLALAFCHGQESEPPPKLIVLEMPMSPLLAGAASSSLSLSPDGKRVGFLRRSADGAKWTAVIDGIEGPAYDAMGKLSPLFSPDSKRVAYIAGRGGKKLVVLDGAEGPEYDNVGGLAFSPDCRRFACMVERGDDRFIVVDGKEQPQRFDKMSAQGIVFSPDSQRLGYAAKRAGRWSVVLDGREGREYDGAGNLVFSPNSRHYAFLALRREKALVVVDGVESEEYGGMLKGTQLAFSGSGSVEVHAHRAGQIVRLLLSVP
jgi:hypothetical protein